MIDKITPRGLDKSSDHKLVSKASMIDAMNLYIADDYVNEEGNAGILKSVRGNTVVSYATDQDRPIREDAHAKVIGSVTDSKTKIVYLFVWSQFLDDHGVWAFDPYGKLPLSKTEPMGVPNSLRKVFTSVGQWAGFNFHEHGFVKGDIVYTNTNELMKHDAIKDYLNVFSNESLKIDFEKDVLIYFTDNVNEPRRLNAYRALLETTDTEFANYIFTDKEDLVCACPKTPLDRITFEWDTDVTILTNNFATTPGFQYAYQAIYKDKIESAISVYSTIAFPNSVVNRGAAAANLILAHNLCRLNIPQLGPEVETIRILARYGNSSNFFEIDEVPNLVVEDSANWNAGARIYNFRNDRVGFGVSFTEVNKTFDKLPRKAQAQTTISNRLIYGNYLENFDNVKTDCTSRVIYKPRPKDYLDYVLKVRPSVHRTPYGNNKSVGFDLDTTEFSSQVYAGTEISVTINYTPDQNFHLYQADGAYHQSRQVGKESNNAYGYKRWPFESNNNLFYILSNSYSDEEDAPDSVGQSLDNGVAWPGSPAGDQESGSNSVQKRYDWASSSYGDDPSVPYLEGYGERFFGRNYGVGSDGNNSTTLGFPFYSGANAIGSESNLPIWGAGVDAPVAYHALYGDSIATNSGTQIRARYGTSAGNPLILQGAPLEFKVSFTVTNDELWNGKKLIAETVAEALAGGTGNQLSWSNYVQLNEVQNTQTVDIDLGLNGGSPGNYNFSKIRPGDPNSYLVTGVGESLSTDNTISAHASYHLVQNGNHSSQCIPMGYFIVNKAEVEFNLEIVNGGELSYPNWAYGENQVNSGTSTNSKLRVAISRIDPVGDDGILTCIKKIDPRSPWWTVSKSVLSDSTFQNHVEEGTDTAREAFALSDPMFSQNPNSEEDFFNEFATFFDSGILNGKRAVNRRCFGWIGHSDVNSFFRGSTGGPQLNQSKFRFSLMDGEGGPGGSEAGGNSAYDKYGNAGYGSVAARVDIEWDSSVSILAINSISDAPIGISDIAPKFFQAFDGGSNQGGVVGGGINAGDSFGGPQYTSDNEVANEQGLEPVLVADPDTVFQEVPNLWHVKYHVSGPFFTGSINMNPIDSNEDGANASYEANSNPNSYPPIKDYSTTLPLIWVNSRGTPINKYEEDEDTDELFEKNWMRSPYPWPQTIANVGGLPLYNNDGIVSFPVDPLPFSSNYEWPLVDWMEFDSNATVNQNDNNSMVVYPHSPPSQDHFGSVDFTRLHSHIECTGVSSYDSPQLDFRSFKTSAMHEFGVVYYDERGRHGAVNHLDSVYVNGYSTQERGAALHGGVAIQLTLNHEAPDWATNWKVVYSKNTTVSNFVQYSAGGAFIPSGNSSSSDPSRIYVSLNHLQGRPISYTHAWGASDENIELTDSTMPLMYKFTKGDRLRVVSYMLPPLSGEEGVVPPRQYPLSFEFEIADMVSLTADNNPLIIPYTSDTEVDVASNEKQGLFLVVKNNSSCQGFRYEDVASDIHFWGDNCIIEIYTPTKELDADDRLYYEIGEKYNVYNGLHIPNTVTLTEGDVYFRRAAVNMREYDTDGLDGMSGYQPLIVNVTVEDPETAAIEFRIPEANFKSYYIESPVATDLFKSNAISIGRPNAVDHDAREAFKEASVIHSERDITDAGKVSYSSFNSSLAIDKDLDLKSGNVNYLINHDDSVFVIQKDKCGHIPIDRTLISDVMGEESLIASSNFLGTPRYYVGKAGADDNPESVVNINNTAYFAHKSLGKIFRASGVNGVNAISDIGMGSYFREVFNNAMNVSQANGNDVRVVGGYDPIHNEYLVSILNPITYGLIGPVTPPPPPPPDPDPDPDSDVPDSDDPGSGLDIAPYVSISWEGQSFKDNVPDWYNLYYDDGVALTRYNSSPSQNETDAYLTVDVFNADLIQPGESLSVAVHLSVIGGTSMDSVEYTQQNLPYIVDTNSGEFAGGTGLGALTRWVLDTNTPGAQATLDGNHITLTFDDTYTNQPQTQEIITVRFPKDFVNSPFAANTWPKPNMIVGNENIERKTPIYIDITSDGDLDIQPSLDAMGGTPTVATELKALIEWRPDPNAPDPEDPDVDPDTEVPDSGDPDPDIPLPPWDPCSVQEWVGSDGSIYFLDVYQYLAQNGLSSIVGLPEGYTEQDVIDVTFPYGDGGCPIPPPPPPTDPDSFAYTGNMCDYPMLVVTSLDVITNESLTSAYNQVINQIQNGEITSAQATQLFPDFDGDGVIGAGDLLAMNQLISVQALPISCAIVPPPPPPAPTEPLPYTGNMCDYPLLIDSNGNITMDSVSDAYNSVLAQLEAGEITQAEATYILPDLLNAFDSVGAITSGDFSSALNQVIASGGSISCSLGSPEVNNTRNQRRRSPSGRVSSPRNRRRPPPSSGY